MFNSSEFAQPFIADRTHLQLGPLGDRRRPDLFPSADERAAPLSRQFRVCPFTGKS